MKKETTFRKNHVLPFLKTLKNTKFTPIQQMAFIGDPDFILCCNGTYVELELKATDGILSPMQSHKLSETKRCLGIPLVANPENWVKIKSQLRKLDGEHV